MSEQEEEIQLNNDKKLVFYARKDVFHGHDHNAELKITLEINKDLTFRNLEIKYDEGASYVNGYYDIHIYANLNEHIREVSFSSRRAFTSSPPSSGEMTYSDYDKEEWESPFAWEEEFLQNKEYYEKWKNNNMSVEEAGRMLSEIIDYFLPSDNEEDEDEIISFKAGKYLQKALQSKYDYIDVRVEDLISEQ